MSMNVNNYKSGGNGPKYTPEEGIQPAVIISVVGLGLQEGREFNGEKKPPSVQVRLTYELVDELHDFDGEQKPLIISEEFMISSNEKSKCMKRLSALDPDMSITGGDLTKLVGTPCAVQIGHKQGKGTHAGKTFANILSVGKPGRMKINTDTFNTQFSYDPNAHDEEAWDLMPEFLRDKINNRLDKDDAPAPKKSKPAKTAAPELEFDDELPAMDGESDGDW